MPLGEVAGEVLGGLFRVIGNIAAEIIFEILVKGLGYLLCKPFSKNLNSDGSLVIFVGLCAWVFIAIVCYLGYSFVSEQIVIDRCLDLGGSYNYETSKCIN